jgi:hypothetical protein
MNYRTTLLLAFLFMLTGSLAFGQVLPHKTTGSLIVSDTTNDMVYRLTDFDLDGSFHGATEIIEFYYPGSGNPIKVTSDHRGYIYVSDTTADSITRLIDLNGDGDALDAGESNSYVDNGNMSAVLLSSPQGLSFDKDGTLYIVNSGSSGVNDMVCRAIDGNNDGDCNDAGEIVVLYDSVEALNQGLTIILTVPMPCALGPDGYLYVSDVQNALTGEPILRMKDLNGDNDLYDAGEVTYYYDDSVGAIDFSNVDSLAWTHDGKLVMNESSQDLIYIGFDGNSDGDIQDAGEIVLYRSGASQRPDSSKGTAVSGENDLYWDIYVAEYNDPNGCHAMRDLNDDKDFEDSGEFMQVYDDTVGALGLASPKGMTFMKGPSLSYSGTPSVGNTIDINLEGTVGSFYRIAWSLYASDLILPPHGTLHLRWLPNTLATGNIPANGLAVQPVTIPASAFPGLTIYLQALAGDFYLRTLSNRLDVTIL